MAEILFRGKSVVSGEWITGLPCFWINNHTWHRKTLHCKMITAVSPTDDYAKGYAVSTDTVGQFTGAQDCTGKKIFAGDIIKIGGTHGCGAMGVVRIGEYSILPGDEPFNLGAWVDWFYEPDGVYGMRRQELLFWIKEHNIEVCGNIHDNPEMLERKNER